MHQCPHCERQFDNTQALNSHQRSHKSDKSSYIKSKCCCVITKKELVTSCLLNYQAKLITCANCTTIFKPNDNAKYCSRSCAATVTNKNRILKTEKRISEHYGKRPEHCKAKMNFTCKYCYQAFIRDDKKATKLFCSVFCRKSCVSSILSKRAKDQGFGGVRPSKRIKYKDVILGSTYELTMAISLDAHSIAWKIPGRFNYLDSNGKERTYQPDFYLPDYNIYLDPKNDYLINNINPALGFTDVEKITWAMKQNNIVVIILQKSQLSWDFLKTMLVKS